MVPLTQAHRLKDFELVNPEKKVMQYRYYMNTYKHTMITHVCIYILVARKSYLAGNMTIISFLTRNYLSDAQIRKRDIVRAFLLTIPENLFLRFLLAWVRMSALIFYRGDKTKWGSIDRVEIHYD